jgi:hypothetical protein
LSVSSSLISKSLGQSKSSGPAGHWLLHSGIRRDDGGFARYYDATAAANRAVSTEITGYAASALAWLFRVTGDEEYLDAARETARFLAGAWDPQLRVFPFEHPSPSSESEHLSYFFDTGIIIRGLLAVWNETHDDCLFDLARTAAQSMLSDFQSHGDYHPILKLPQKSATPRTSQWSRSAGCYQLKAALAWRDIGCVTGDYALQEAWSEIFDSAIGSHASFLPGADCEQKVMDRLHPYCYFLEGLLPELESPEVLHIYEDGLDTISYYLNKISPDFSRSDVYAQLLRARLNAAERIPVNEHAASGEAAHLEKYQLECADPRLEGGFIFGRRNGSDVMHVNPVSTVFGMQALEMWEDYRSAGSKPPCVRLLI